MNKILAEMEDNIDGSFLSQKINKVRWKPEGNLDSELFVTGSWDNEINSVTLWRYHSNEEKYEDLDVSPCDVFNTDPGDVTEIKFVDNNKFLVSTSEGSLHLMNILGNTRSDNIGIEKLTSWSKLHYFPTGEESACTGIALFHEDIATVGEDGRVSLLSTRQDEPIRVIDDADSCSLSCTIFLKHNELLTGNLRGQMKIWDLRSVSDKPQTIFMLSGEQIGANCMAQHPTQQHLVIAGGNDGSLIVWDLRQNTTPVSLLSAHSKAVNEIQFHPERPEHVFTCSNTGEIWHWNAGSVPRSVLINSDVWGDENPWLSSSSAKVRMVVNTLIYPLHLPINSLDLNHANVICGCDNEAVYVVKNIF